MIKICCVNDMSGIEKVSLSAINPVLSVKGVDVTCLPTALAPNTLGFDEDRGRPCPLAEHVLFPAVNILCHDGKSSADRFFCPDVGTINVFQIERLSG